MSAGRPGQSQAGTARLLRTSLGALAAIVGLAAVVFGVALVLTARPANPVRVDAVVRDYRAVLAGGGYVHSELTLVGDARTYTFDRRSFSPALPDRMYANGEITVWTDGVDGPVIALTLPDEHGLNPTTYATLFYDSPEEPLWLREGEGLAIVVLGLALGAGVPLMLRRRGRRNAAARTHGREADADLPTDKQAAAKMPAVVGAARLTAPPAGGASAPPATSGEPSSPGASQSRWSAAGPPGNTWESAELMSGPTPGAPRVERTIPTFPPASGSAGGVRPPAIDDLPTARTPAASSTQMPRPPSASPPLRSYPPASGSIPGAPPELPRFGPGGSAAASHAGAYVPGQPWQPHGPSMPDHATPRPGTRLVPGEPPAGPGAPSPSSADVVDAPTTPTPAVIPPAEHGAAGPRQPLWPPARDTNGH